MSTAVATRPPRISGEFLNARRRERILRALADLISDRGYFETRIADIVRQAGVARKTFYDTFDGKEAATRALVQVVNPSVSAFLESFDLEGSGLAVFAIERCADIHAGEDDRAACWLDNGVQLLDEVASLAPGVLASDASADPLRCTLPPGRNGLAEDWKAQNQRTRILRGLAVAVGGGGVYRCTIADVCRHAAVSRRTFYEHFDDRDGAALALLFEVGVEAPAGTVPIATEVVSVALVKDMDVLLVHLDRVRSVIADLSEGCRTDA